MTSKVLNFLQLLLFKLLLASLCGLPLTTSNDGRDHFNFLQKFSQSSTTTKPSPYVKNVDHIFTLLADIHPVQEGSTKPLDLEENEVEPSATKIPEAKTDPSTLKNYFKMLNSLAKVTLRDSQPVKDILETVEKVSDIYELEKQKQNLTKHLQNKPKDGKIHTASRVIKHLLEPPNMKKVFEISKKAKDEDEILEHLTSIILGAEDRSGGYHSSGLTLDPVTCIALITLAAYLIRAVFHLMLALNGMDRSLSGPGSYLPLTLSNLPAIMVNVHNMISTSEVNYDRIKRNVHEPQEPMTTGNSLLDLSAELALFMKLTIDNHQPCIRNFICHNLAGKFFKDFGIPQYFWALVGLYKKQFETAKYVFKTIPNKKELCQFLSAECEDEATEETIVCEPCSSQTMEEYQKMHSWVTGILKLLPKHSKHWT